VWVLGAETSFELHHALRQVLKRACISGTRPCHDSLSARQGRAAAGGGAERTARLQSQGRQPLGPVTAAVLASLCGWCPTFAVTMLNAPPVGRCSGVQIVCQVLQNCLGCSCRPLHAYESFGCSHLKKKRKCMQYSLVVKRPFFEQSSMELRASTDVACYQKQVLLPREHLHGVSPTHYTNA